MNKVILMGRLTSNPELRYSNRQNPLAVCRYTLAVDRNGKEKGTDFINCVCFGKAAEFVNTTAISKKGFVLPFLVRCRQDLTSTKKETKYIQQMF